MIFFKKLVKLFLKMLNKKNKPCFFIVGAQKCGTTSLFSYLDSLEGFVGSKPKEVHFFDRDERFEKGFEWYERKFRLGFKSSNLYFEASPTYLFKENVAQRIYDYQPDAKIIILLREPIARAYSAWNMYREWAEEGHIPTRMKDDVDNNRPNPLYDVFFKGKCPTFEEYINIELDLIESGVLGEEPSILRRGLYKQQIERYVNLFGWDNVLVLGFNELKNDSESIIEKCHDFLGVPYKIKRKLVNREIRNKRVYPSKIDQKNIEILESFYNEPNRELVDYLGKSLDW